MDIITNMKVGKEYYKPICPSGFRTFLIGDFLEGDWWVEWSAQGVIPGQGVDTGLGEAV